jgi:hypothetical protein
LEYYKDRLKETLVRLTILYNEIHDLSDDNEYEADLPKCKEYIESAKHAILRTSRHTEKCLATSVSNVMITDTRKAVATAAPIAPFSTLRLPPIKLGPFSGDIETWARFWEQFEQSIDKDPELSTIHKHMFLRGYLEEEPKHLVEGTAVVAETYEETKTILKARYGDKDRIIQAHLDHLEGVKPFWFATQCYPLLRPTSFSPIMPYRGNSSPLEWLGGEDGGHYETSAEGIGAVKTY